MANDTIIETSDTSFEQDVLRADKPVLVDFWAGWCVPCKQLSPLIDEIASEYGSKLAVAKLDVDKNPAVPTNYAIRSIPTLILFKGGKVVDQIIGNQRKDDLKRFLDSHV
ncbi:MAG: thioredoxin [Burkholderiaceae bacterium]|jgi:thioredoxin 1|nr:thioredoxin [Burkholderiaceae bacterium]